MLKSKLEGLKHGLGSFTNAELYYIVSELFKLGGMPDHFIETERLFIKPNNHKSHKSLKFLYINQWNRFAEFETERTSRISFGSINDCFSNIEIFTITVPESNFDIHASKLNFYELNEYLTTEVVEHSISNPIRLTDSLDKIISQEDFDQRGLNPLFEQNDIYEKSYTNRIDMSPIRDIDFSGIYYKISIEGLFLDPKFVQIFSYELNESIYNECEEVELILTEQSLEKSFFKKFN